MKKIILILVGLFSLFGTAFANLADLRSLLPPYWIVGRVEDNTTTGVRANGRIVVFYADDAALTTGNYVTAEVVNNQFILNAFHIWPTVLSVGTTYKLATERLADNYGASGRVTISGNGWDLAAMGGLINSGGIAQPGTLPVLTVENKPAIKIWFGNRLYQPAIVAAGQPFIISNTPQIRAEISIDTPDTVSGQIRDYSIVIDPGTSNSKTLALSASNMTAQSYAAGNAVKAFTLSYDISETDKLADGPHIFNFHAKSSGARGIQATAVEAATVEVAGGPLRVIGTPLVFPTPFRIHQDTNLTIQYVLSQNADIDLTIYSVEGRMVRKIYCNRGAEGGSAGINKVTWNGVRDDGMRAGAGVYIGSIVSREENRLLAKFKPAIVE